MSFRALKIAAPSESNVRMLRDLDASLSDLLTPFDQSAKEHALAEPTDLGNSDVVSQLAALISLVEESQRDVAMLVATVNEHEAIARELKNRISEEVAQKDAAHQLLAKAGSVVRVESERAEAAEARSKSAEEKLQGLQEREAVVRERIDRLTANVSSLAVAGQFRSPLTAASFADPKRAADRAA